MLCPEILSFPALWTAATEEWKGGLLGNAGIGVAFEVSLPRSYTGNQLPRMRAERAGQMGL